MDKRGLVACVEKIFCAYCCLLDLNTVSQIVLSVWKDGLCLNFLPVLLFPHSKLFPTPTWWIFKKDSGRYAEK